MTVPLVVDSFSCRHAGGPLALDRFSLSVPRGSVTGIVGPNGAGKTTLINAICGWVRPLAGRVLVFGQDVRSSGRAVRRQLGLVPQETALYAEVSVWHNLEFAAALHGLRQPAARIREALEVVGLSDRAAVRAGTLSGGLQRRLVVARALLHAPQLLILDEPTLGVDSEARHQIWAHVRRLRAEGRTILLTTNHLDEAEALCDRLAVLRSGRLLAEDTPQRLMARAGRCLELACESEALPRLRAALGELPGVLRSEPSVQGLLVYFAVGVSHEPLVRRALELGSLGGFRARSPDLVELFQAWPDPSPVAQAIPKS